MHHHHGGTRCAISSTGLHCTICNHRHMHSPDELHSRRRRTTAHHRHSAYEELAQDPTPNTQHPKATFGICQCALYMCIHALSATASLTAATASAHCHEQASPCAKQWADGSELNGMSCKHSGDYRCANHLQKGRASCVNSSLPT
jgi:hypothetical protein